MYWIYRTDVYSWRGRNVQAMLVDPTARDLITIYGQHGFRNPQQQTPYGVDLHLTFQVDPGFPHPDNYFQNAGFTLYSERLVDLMQTFDVKAEVLPVVMVDKHGAVLSSLNYFVFHVLEGVLNAMNEEASEWTGDRDAGVPRLVLDESRFEQRPLFYCNHLYVPLMRDDVKREIERRKITGFAFLAPEHFRSGGYGFPSASDYVTLT